MKRVLVSLTAALLAATAAGGAFGALPAIAAGEPIDVWLIGGQSNAVGYAQGLPESNDDPRFTSGFENVLFWGEYESDYAAARPSDFVPVTQGLGKAYNSSDRRSGAELGIASALGDSGTMNAVIKYAWGATFLYPDTGNSVSTRWGTWTPPSYREEHPECVVNDYIGLLYDNFLEIVAEGLEKLGALGYTPVIRGMWWMQGEAESPNATHANAYYELLTDFIRDLRGDLTTVTGQDCSAMPFVIGKIYRNPEYPAMAQIETVRAAQEQAAQTLANVATVDCTELAQQDGWHYTADAQLSLGQQFVQQVSAMDGKYWVSCTSDHVDFAGGGAKEEGDSVTVTLSARRGWRIGSVLMQTGAAQAVPVTLTNGSYSFTMPDENVLFTAEMQALPFYRLTEYSCNDTAMGSIYPSAEARDGWYEGESVTIGVMPKQGYTVARATVNGTEISPSGEQNGGYTYTISVAADAQFYVEFAAEGADEPSGGSEETPSEGGCGAAVGGSLGALGAAIGLSALAAMLLAKRRRG